MQMIEVRVQVPSDRETDFYRWFADWRDGTIVSTFSSDPTMEETPEMAPGDELEPIVAWWKTLTAKERAIWGMWLNAAPGMVSADEIVAGLGLKSARDIPGVLSWSGRKGRRVGFRAHWEFRIDPVSGQPIYGIENEEYARQLRQARELAEAKPITSQTI